MILPNFYTLKKIYVMTIKNLVAIAFAHFHAAQTKPEQVRERIKAFAIEELELSEEKAALFARISEKDVVHLEDAMDFDEFFIWYYINYMVSPGACPARR
jgi:hypothetical protein